MARFLKWLWASYETLALWQWLAALPIGGGGWGVMATFTNIPLWQQALIAAGIALIWLTVWAFASRLFHKKERNPVAPTQSGSDNQQAHAGGDVTQSSGGAGSGQMAGRDAFAAGRDLNINALPVQPQTPWIFRAGGPQFRFHTSFQGREVRIDCSFNVTSQLLLNYEYRWLGLGADTDWERAMAQNQPGSYQVKSATLHPDLDSDDNAITLEIRFWLEDGQLHGGRWQWPVKARGDGVWELRAELGSHVFQPRDSDWW
mgnify:CR=1 FL=1